MALRVSVARSPPRASRWQSLGAPSACYALAGRLQPWCWGAALLFGLTALVTGLGFAPTDVQQGDAYRIIFVHVPVAWMSMLIYVVMACCAGLGLVLDTRVAPMWAGALAPTGALMTFLALWTGALWGKPSWGAWWVWDARLTSELLLLLLYVGFMALQAGIDDRGRRDRVAGAVALAGLVNVPILYFSVRWWNTLHQGSGVDFDRVPAGTASVMLAGMLLMTASMWAWSTAAALHRLRSIILEREGDADWVGRLPEVQR